MIEPTDGPVAVRGLVPSGSDSLAKRRRVLGWMIDYAVAITIMLGLVAVGLVQLIQGLPSYFGAVAADAGWVAIKLVTHGGHGLPGEIGDAAGDEWGTLITPLLLCLAAAAVFQFLYQAVLLSWWGGTLGKIATRTRVRQDLDGTRLTRRQAVIRALITTASETGILAFACILLALGHFILSVLVWTVAVAVFWTNYLCALRGRHHRTLADRVAGTTVLPSKPRPLEVPLPMPVPEWAMPPPVPVAQPGSGLSVPPPPPSLSTRVKQQASTLGSVGADQSRQLAQRAQALGSAVGSAGADQTRRVGQQAFDAFKARRTRRDEVRAGDPDIAPAAEQRVHRDWMSRRQQTTPPPTEGRTASLLGLDLPEPPRVGSLRPETTNPGRPDIEQDDLLH